MKTVIMGSGAVGAYVGARLQAAGADVTFIARGAHLQAMQQHGLQIEMPGKDLLLPSVKATSDPTSIGEVDMVVFAVKLTDTVTAAQSLRSAVGSTKSAMRSIPPFISCNSALPLRAIFRCCG
jgi:2-dehydropantoate 2-reductase